MTLLYGNLQRSPSDPITELAYCRGDTPNPDNLVEIDGLSIKRYILFINKISITFSLVEIDGLSISNTPFCQKILQC